jgi:TolB-like protein
MHLRSDQAATSLDHASRTALEALLLEPEFARAPRLSALLRFIVEQTLAGKGGRLKAFVIAQAVFGRDETFDPTTDTIVRVEAGRLRRVLERYYLTRGVNNSIRISVPKGGYRAVFSEQPWKTEKATSASPFLAVLPLETFGADEKEMRLARGLVEAIITDVTQLPDVSVMAHASVLGFEVEAGKLRELGVTHILRGSLALEDNVVRVTQQLIELDTQKITWTMRRERPMDKLLALERGFARQIAEGLAVEVSQQGAGAGIGAADPFILARFREGMLSMTPPSEYDRVVAAREIFSRLIDSDPGFPGGHTGLAFTLAAGISAGVLKDPEHDLQIAFESVQRAVEIDDRYGFAHGTLAVIHALRGEIAPAHAESELALQLQPGDAATLFAAGWAYQLAMRADLGVGPMEEALRLDPIEPRTPYMNTLGIAYLTCRKPMRSLELFDRSVNRGGPAPMSLNLFRAVAHVMLEQDDNAREILKKLPRPMPGARQIVEYGVRDGWEPIHRKLCRLGLVVE